jgi:hypothetical protein
VAKETRYTRKSVDAQREEFATLLEEHKEWIQANLPCNTVSCPNGQAPSRWKLIPETIKIIYSVLGIGSCLILIFGLIFLKKYGIL